MQHPDEGTIHAWLDGALDARESAELEAHVAACPACADAVAEARGLIAGASRVLSALDDVPAGVIPAAPREERAVAADVVPLRGGSAPRRRFRVSPAWMAAAAVLVVAVGSLVTMSRSGEMRTDRLEESVARDMRATAAPQAADTTAPAPTADRATEALGTSAQKVADSTSVARVRTVQPMAATQSKVASPQPPMAVAAAPQKASDEARREVSARAGAPVQEKRMAAGTGAGAASGVAPGAVSGVAADARAGNVTSAASLAGCYEIAPDTAMGFARPEVVQRAQAPAPSRAPVPAQARAAERVSDAVSSTSMLPARFLLDTAASTLSPNARAVVAPLEGGTVRGFWVQVARDSARVVWTSRERPPLVLFIAPSGVRAVTSDGVPVSLRPCRR